MKTNGNDATACDCVETNLWATYGVPKFARFHDCKYVEARNKLIPEAVRRARYNKRGNSNRFPQFVRRNGRSCERFMTDFARVASYTEPPTKSDLQIRIAAGEVIRGVDAFIAQDYGLGRVMFPMFETAALVPVGQSSTFIANKLKQQR
jgi:hypothetical protein